MASPKNLLKKIAVPLATISAIAPAILSASCDAEKEKQDKIVFATAQGDTWPLMRAMKELVKEYNTNHKNDPDFKPVELWTQTQTKTYAELELVNNTVKQLSDNSAVTPNILLNNQSGAFILKSRNDYLDLSSIGNDVHFDPKIKKAHSILAGQSLENKEILYNLPFDVADTDAVLFNLDIMNKIFTLIMENGGTVDPEMDLYKRSVKAAQTGTSIPTNSPFHYMKAKENNAFNTMNVNADTFKSYKGIRDFVKNVNDNIDFEQIPADAHLVSANLLSMDYQEDIFLKELYGLGDGEANSTLWDLVATTDPNQPSKIDFTKLNDSNSKVSQNFIKLWNEWKAASASRDLFTPKDANGKLQDPIRFQSIQYKLNGGKDWGSFDIRKYQSAISFAASVGQNYTQQSTWSINYFLNKVENPKETQTYKNWATHDDVFALPQTNQSVLNGKKVYWEGGSSLVGVKGKSEALDKATIAFLKWIYNGSINNVPNWKTIALISGYVLPYTDVVKQSTIDELKTEHDQYVDTWRSKYAEIAATKAANATLTDAQKQEIATKETEADQALEKANNLRSAIISLESLLNFAKSEDVAQAKFAGDLTAKKVVQKLSTDLVSSNTVTNTGAFESTSDGAAALSSLQAETHS